MSKKKIVIGGAFAAAGLVALTYIAGKALSVLGSDEVFDDFGDDSFETSDNENK
jgi:hypothetical protein